MDAIKVKVKTFIIDNFLYGEDDGFEDDDSLLENGVFDSTGVLELVEFIEEIFSVEIDDDELVPENLDSLKKITEFISRKQ